MCVYKPSEGIMRDKLYRNIKYIVFLKTRTIHVPLTHKQKYLSN